MPQPNHFSIAIAHPDHDDLGRRLGRQSIPLRERRRLRMPLADVSALTEHEVWL